VSRFYTITPTTDINVSAARELLAFKVPPNKIVRIHEAKNVITQAETSQQLAYRIGVLTADVAGVTTGISVKRHDPGNPAPGLTNIWKDGPLGIVVTDEWVDFQADDIRVGYLFRPIPKLIITHVSGNVVGLGLLEAPGAPTLMRPSFKIEVIG
jgi:hypothetical protein